MPAQFTLATLNSVLSTSEKLKLTELIRIQQWWPWLSQLTISKQRFIGAESVQGAIALIKRMGVVVEGAPSLGSTSKPSTKINSPTDEEASVPQGPNILLAIGTVTDGNEMKARLASPLDSPVARARSKFADSWQEAIPDRADYVYPPRTATLWAVLKSMSVTPKHYGANGYFNLNLCFVTFLRIGVCNKECQARHRPLEQTCQQSSRSSLSLRLDLRLEHGVKRLD
ncbi:hypothetical protein CC80DRAFT_549256 [Byssothecium circinans]|uniref:Uncharacterized protein n=1 Tax=Byssothecium circinans TaxID=147558 RepID=A0A6A5U335_9PLEO|nr:hypothetical protein CC80DRAFT_549256 [Byssothecium circinans]